jgi:hypothetical protein
VYLATRKKRCCSEDPSKGVDMFKKLLVLLTLTVALPLCSRADSVGQCAAGDLNIIVNTTCAIGDKTFQFGTFSLTLFGNVIAENPGLTIFFTPDDSNPNSPGFILSATSGLPFNTPPATTNESGFIFSLPYTVSTASGNIIGTTVATTDSSDSVNGGGGSAEATAMNALTPGSFLCVDIAESGATSGTLPYPGTNNSLILGCGGVTMTPGTATLTLLEQNGTASLHNAGFFIDESTGSKVGGGGGMSARARELVALCRGTLATRGLAGAQRPAAGLAGDASPRRNS